MRRVAGYCVSWFRTIERGGSSWKPKIVARDFRGLYSGPHINTEVKRVNQSQYRPGQALRVPGLLGSQISRQSGQEFRKVASLTHRPSLPF